ncbi:16S rRNA (adenine(1518)-N(6)/adenine(1519)-N(6))-dimethyltransferase RsmA [Georgenia sunbinii]|uniref:16S rRNA (adenine(1518)-N(6)/adenine(1519)-N(6))- dimethyltransferase RsmA n=1 Tax=Georgenia sunbinii TaxID=3117728 RepID=UPI003D9C3ED6
MTDPQPAAPVPPPAGVSGEAPPPAALLGPADVRALAARLGIRPTKTLGQNFVVDAGTVRRIVRIAGTGPGDVVLEVGPGLGSLTLALLATGAHVVAIEIDPVLAAALPGTVAQRMPDAAGRLTVVEADAMAVTELPALPDGTPAAPDALVANLPYNVAVPVLLTLLERMPSLRSGLVMVQAEVADRLAAPPGSRTYGVPSAKAAWYADTQRSATIGRTVFWPVPNVDSALVRLERRDPPSTTAGRAEVFAVVDAAFGQRRKTLRSALAGWAGSPVLAAEAVTAAGLDPTLRGERLGIVDFARIAEHRPVPSAAQEAR